MTRTTSTVSRIERESAALAAWSAAYREISGPGDDLERDKILDDLHGFTQFATDGEVVLLRAPGGRALIKPHDVHPDAALTIVYAPHGGGKLTSFWMNRPSLAGLIERVASAAEPVDFEALLASEEVRL